MSIFGKILSKIFPSNHPAVAQAEAPAPMVAQPGATMNVWLHKQVMKKIADNGGKLPDDLKA
jgi:hypothetical protein